MGSSLEDKVRRLLDLLDEVENGFREEPRSVESELAITLVDKLDAVACVVGDQYEKVSLSVCLLPP